MINDDAITDTPIIAIDDVLPSRKYENIISVGTYTSILYKNRQNEKAMNCRHSAQGMRSYTVDVYNMRNS